MVLPVLLAVGFQFISVRELAAESSAKAPCKSEFAILAENFALKEVLDKDLMDQVSAYKKGQLVLVRVEGKDPKSLTNLYNELASSTAVGTAQFPLGQINDSKNPTSFPLTIKNSTQLKVFLFTLKYYRDRGIKASVRVEPLAVVKAPEIVAATPAETYELDLDKQKLKASIEKLRRNSVDAYTMESLMNFTQGVDSLTIRISGVASSDSWKEVAKFKASVIEPLDLPLTEIGSEKMKGMDITCPVFYIRVDRLDDLETVISALTSSSGLRLIVDKRDWGEVGL